MKLAVTGGSKYALSSEDMHCLQEIAGRLKITQVITSGSRGAEWAVEEWARAQNIPVQRLAANYSSGATAALENNAQIAASADALLAFPGGPRSEHLMKQCRSIGVPIFETQSWISARVAEQQTEDTTASISV